MLAVTLLSVFAAMSSVNANWGVPPIIPPNTPQQYCGCWTLSNAMIRRQPGAVSGSTSNAKGQYCLDKDNHGYNWNKSIHFENCDCSAALVRANGYADGKYKEACDCRKYQKTLTGFMIGSTSLRYFKPACGDYDWTQLPVVKEVLVPLVSPTVKKVVALLG